ncbi:MAG: hypothetical protein ACKVU4_02435 [Phycisphaerales bacterium]
MLPEGGCGAGEGEGSEAGSGEAGDGGGGAAGFEELLVGGEGLGLFERGLEGVECCGGLGEGAVAEAGNCRVLLAGAEVVAGGDDALDLGAIDPRGVLNGVDAGGIVQGGDELAVPG